MTNPLPWKPPDRMVALALGCLALVAASLLLLSTPWGLGLGGDSYYYVSGARGILAGQGFVRPAADGTTRAITHFPPLYPAILAGLGAIGPDIPSAARLLHAVLFGGTAFMTGWLVWLAVRRSWAAFAASALFAFSPAMIGVHSWLLSEAVFLFLILAAAAGLAQYLAGRRIRDLLAAALIAGLALLTRYVGLALVLAGAGLLAWWPGRPPRRCWIDAGTWLALSGAGWLGWTVRNGLLSGSLANRGLSVHLPTAQSLTAAVVTITRWVLPGPLPIPVAAALVIGLAVGLMVAPLRRFAVLRTDSLGLPHALLTLCLVFEVVYVLLLAASLSFADASTPLDDRILSPLFVLGLPAGMLVLVYASRRSRQMGRLTRGALAGLTILMLARGLAKANQLRQDGQGYASREWRQSSLVGWVSELDPGTTVYSNELDALYLLTGRQAYQVPIRWDPVRAEAREDLPDQLAQMQQRILGGQAVLVLFDSLATQQAFLPTEEQLTEGLVGILEAPDGSVYGAAR